MRAVVDTNLLLRMAASRQQLPLYRAWRERRFTLVVSSPVVDEFTSVMERPKVRRFLPSGHGQAFVALLRSLALFVDPAADFPRCRDPKDDIVIATAVAASPCFLVTSDRDLYDDADLAARMSELAVEVIQAGEFLARLHS
jgi:putative PIN family toxin of toxin-antitoxin system